MSLRKWSGSEDGRSKMSSAPSTPKATVGGEDVVGYRREDRVNPGSMTESFVALRILIDTWRWEGVPFYVRMGKRLPKEGDRDLDPLQAGPRGPVQCTAHGPGAGNVLVIRIQPDEGISLKMQSKIPGPALRMRNP